MIGDMFVYAENYEHRFDERVLLRTPVLYYVDAVSIETTCVESDIYPYHSAGFNNKDAFKCFYTWKGDPRIYNMYMFSRESNVWEALKRT